MDTISLAPLGINGMQEIIITFILIVVMVGCVSANAPGEYRESQGSVVKFTVEQSTPVLTITWFVKLQDGLVIRPKIFFYQARQVLFAFRSVEESARIWQITSTKARNFLYLPYSKEINTYLLLIRAPLPKEVEKDGKIETIYEQSEWQLLEIPAKEVSPEEPIVIPAFEELIKRELPKEKQELLNDLVTKYNAIATAAKKRMDTPMSIKGRPVGDSE